MNSVTKEFNFCAAHQLPGHATCGVLHGHNYRVLVTFASDHLDDYGMVIDFGRIKDAVGPLIDFLDHSNLNETINVKTPTAENIAMYLASLIQLTSDKDVADKLRSVRVYETPTSCATFEVRRD